MTYRTGTPVSYSYTPDPTNGNLYYQIPGVILASFESSVEDSGLVRPINVYNYHLLVWDLTGAAHILFNKGELVDPDYSDIQSTNESPGTFMLAVPHRATLELPVKFSYQVA